MAFQLRRGTNAQRLGLTPLQGELIYTTDTKALYVGDGTTAGGTTVGSGGGGGPVDLNELSDVTINGGTLASGQVLKFNGTNWTNGTDEGGGAPVDLNDITDVTINGLTLVAGQVLKFDGTLWSNADDSNTGAAVLSINGQVGDVDLDTDDILEGLNQYFTDERSVLATANAFEDGVQTGIQFTYDGPTNSISATIVEGDIQDLVGNFLEVDGTGSVDFTYDTLTNTLTSTVSTSSLSDVLFSATVADGDVLRYDQLSGKWTNATALVNDDPSPLLAASLDVNGQTIIGVGAIDLEGGAILESISLGKASNAYAAGISIATQTAWQLGGTPVLDIISSTNLAIGSFSTLYRTRGTIETPTATVAGDRIFGFRFVGQGTNLATESSSSAIIAGRVDPNGTVATTFAPGLLEFQVRNNAGSIVNALVLDRDGKITVASNTLVAGGSSGQVNTGSVASYLSITVGSTQYALPLYGINP